MDEEISKNQKTICPFSRILVLDIQFKINRFSDEGVYNCLSAQGNYAQLEPKGSNEIHISVGNVYLR